ncbi:hypothetical protein LBMAG56_02910 [Verrucomicrobiota bacterium]|nr:hypothetical protein LBMAG56_02910 [Verrucomicrobiota bacterium]
MTNSTRSLAIGMAVTGALLSGATAAQAQANKSPWESSAALGFTLTRGNSSTLLFTGNVLTSRKQGNDEVSLGADATYGANSGVTTAQAFRGFGQYNRLFSDRAYGLLRAEGLYDKIAAVQPRVTISAGLGYYFVKTDRTKLSGEVGPSLVYERSAGGASKTYMALRVAERLDHKISDKTKIWQSAEFLPQVDNFNNYILNLEAGLETELYKNLALRTYVQDSYHKLPAAGRQKNDLKFVTAVAYKF